MTADPSRVPTNPREGWSVETVLDHVLTLIAANDKRYAEIAESVQRAIDLAFAAQRDAVNAAFAAQKEAVNAALSAADRAVLKAETSAEKRFEAVNEFRGTLSDQQRTLMPREEANARLDALAEKLAGVMKQMDNLQSERTGVRGGWGYAVGVVSFVVMILAVIGFLMTRLGGG